MLFPHSVISHAVDVIFAETENYNTNRTSSTRSAVKYTGGTESTQEVQRKGSRSARVSPYTSFMLSSLPSVCCITERRHVR